MTRPHPARSSRRYCRVRGGAAYHSARSARDRDRLRQQVLERLGWRLHRIWSTDWFRNPARETARLLGAIEEACASVEAPGFPKVGPAPENPAEQASPTDRPAPESAISDRPDPTGAIAREPLPHYHECRLTAPTGRELLDLSGAQLVDLVVAAIEAEGPIHVEEVARRVREAFGLERTGRRIREAIANALRLAAQGGRATSEDGFWSAPGGRLALPRDRRSAALSLRHADRIAPDEFRLAMLLVLDEAVAIEDEELITETARLLGFDRTGSDLRMAIRRELAQMIENNGVVMEDRRIRRAPLP